MQVGEDCKVFDDLCSAEGEGSPTMQEVVCSSAASGQIKNININKNTHKRP